MLRLQRDINLHAVGDFRYIAVRKADGGTQVVAASTEGPFNFLKMFPAPQPKPPLIRPAPSLPPPKTIPSLKPSPAMPPRRLGMTLPLPSLPFLPASVRASPEVGSVIRIRSPEQPTR